uniref:Uncharacterized protein n=1 Tax=Cacopsylla melanoneura TaxID=428564 RepID=A0A8D8TJZ9_9HEMI
MKVTTITSVIEKAIAKSLKGGPIYVPGDYVRIIRNAKKKTGDPYVVHELTNELFLDIKKMVEHISPHHEKAMSNNDVKLSEIRIFKVEKNRPLWIFFKSSYSEPDFYEIDVNPESISPSTRSAKS